MIRTARDRAEELARAVESERAECPDQELARVFHAVADSFEPDRAPVEQITARVADKVRRQPAAPAGRPARRWLWRPATVAVALTVLTAMSVVSRPAPPGARAIITNALSAIEEPGKITYYKIVSRSTGPMNRPPEIIEHWVDYERKMQKVVSSGTEDVLSTLTKDGKTIQIEGRGAQVDVSEWRAREPFSDRLKDEIDNYRSRLKAGGGRLGEETINGIETFKIRLESRLGDSGRIDERKMKVVLTMNVRQDNFYPVRISSETYLVDSKGKMEPSSSHTDSLEEIKLIDRADLPPDFFSLDIPPGAPYRASHTYTVKDARDFKDFDLYYVGEEFEGFEFAGRFVYQNERNGVPASKAWPPEMVDVSYYMVEPNMVEPHDGFGIRIWRKLDPEIIIAAGYAGGEKTVIDINGEPATFVEKNWGRVTTRVLLMQKGRSTVEVQAGDRDTLIRAARKLIKVN